MVFEVWLCPQQHCPVSNLFRVHEKRQKTALRTDEEDASERVRLHPAAGRLGGRYLFLSLALVLVGTRKGNDPFGLEGLWNPGRPRPASASLIFGRSRSRRWSFRNMRTFNQALLWEASLEATRIVCVLKENTYYPNEKLARYSILYGLAAQQNKGHRNIIRRDLAVRFVGTRGRQWCTLSSIVCMPASSGLQWDRQVLSLPYEKQFLKVDCNSLLVFLTLTERTRYEGQEFAAFMEDVEQHHNSHTTWKKLSLEGSILFLTRYCALLTRHSRGIARIKTSSLKNLPVPCNLP